MIVSDTLKNPFHYIHICYFVLFSRIDTPCYEGTSEVILTAKKVLNSLGTRRICGQAETHHSLLNLPLTICSEIMVPIRISGWMKLYKPSKHTPSDSSTNFITTYCYRSSYPEMSMWQYFHHIYNKDKNVRIHVPYAIGMNSTPIYPYTSDYARGSLIKHCPWSNKKLLHLQSNTHVIEKFMQFISSNQCPKILKMESERARNMYNMSFQHGEPTNTNIHSTDYEIEDDMSDDEYGNETECILKLMSTFSKNIKRDYMFNGLKFERGVDYDWGERRYDRDLYYHGKDWLQYHIQQNEKYEQNNMSTVDLPTDSNGKVYNLSRLTNEQSGIAYAVIQNIHQYLRLSNKPHKPLYITVKGKAGTGKSFLIHTLVTAVRRMTQCNDSVIVTSPTGMYYIHLHMNRCQFIQCYSIYTCHYF